MLCEPWFDDYRKLVSTNELNSFVGTFRSKVDRQHYAARFELLTHQVLIRLGCSVKIHPDLYGKEDYDPQLSRESVSMQTQKLRSAALAVCGHWNPHYPWIVGMRMKTDWRCMLATRP